MQANIGSMSAGFDQEQANILTMQRNNRRCSLIMPQISFTLPENQPAKHHCRQTLPLKQRA